MFSLFPTSSAPLAGLLTAQNVQVASMVLVFASVAIALVFGKRGCGDGGSCSSDCGDTDGGSCD
jgi:hypothetical protein